MSGTTMEKLIITVAPNGAIATKEMTPHVPVTVREVVDDAVRCWEAGASVLHYHARDANQQASLDYNFFRDVLEGVRARTTLIVQISTGKIGADREERIRAVDLRPDMMSLNVGSTNFGDRTYVNGPDEVEYWSRRMLEFEVIPEIECFDVGHIHAGIRLCEKQLVRTPALFNFVLGVANALPYDRRHLLHMIDTIPPGAMWNVIGLGRNQLPAATLATVLGGNVRVGLEDNIYYSYKVLATNAQLVDRAVRVARELQRPVATPAEARQILGIKNS